MASPVLLCAQTTQYRVRARVGCAAAAALRRAHARHLATSSDDSSEGRNNNDGNGKNSNTTSRLPAIVAATAVATAAASALYVCSSQPASAASVSSSMSSASAAFARLFMPALIRNDARPVEPSPALPSAYVPMTGGAVEFPRAARFASTSTRTLSDEEVSDRLREHEEAYVVDRANGVGRFDIVQLASNTQIEDDYTAKIVNVGFADGQKSDWCFFGVFDGHGGWNTSAKLRELLVPYVARELMETIKPETQPTTFGIETPENARRIDRAIEMAFLKLDDDIVKKPVNYLLENPYKPASPEILMPAMSGSCALLSIYDSATQTLRVACTGDSRAVWGHKDAAGKWTATPLSYDQCGRNETEATRIRKEHPVSEKDAVIRDGRVLGGLEPTRAFGDARYKLPAPVLDNAAKLFFGRTAPKASKTPPYVTARPEIITTKVVPGDFLVLATDGVWDELTSRDVVSLVVEWIRNHEVHNGGVPPPGVAARVRKGGFLKAASDLADVPVISDTAELEARVEARTNEAELSKFLLRQSVLLQKHFRGLFTIEDDNVSTHIVRNALGGADKDETAMLLSIPPPTSRRYRDDMTCLVVFFGDSSTEPAGTGRITQIQSATNRGSRS
ncbi:phosphatase 2C-like domain-containing protein [Limtongia smithiae]|uniref:phosphatase 2C-like domain-containing protein n=1 Tax=Limtongia smithiae TaxID=1125753 RepID=UPI0034CEC2F7